MVIFNDNLIKEIKVIQISAGFRNTIFLTEARKIYFSGCLGNYLNQNYPILYNSGEKVNK